VKRAPSATEAFDQLCSRWAGLVSFIDQRRPFQQPWAIENALVRYLWEATTILGGSFAEVIECLCEERDPLLVELICALPRDDRDGALHRTIRKLHHWRNYPDER
jgi:hypothetical protein